MPLNTLDFIEALSVNNKENRQMSGYLAKILKLTNHISVNREVPLFAIGYLADFDLKVSEALHAKMLQGLKDHLD